MSFALSTEEKKSYVEALTYIATLEDGICEDEKAYFVDIATKYGLSQEDTESSWIEISNASDIEQILKPINRREVKLLLIYELIAMCYADGNYSAVEKEGMSKIASLLDVNSEKLRSIECCLEESIRLHNETLKVLEMEV